MMSRIRIALELYTPALYFSVLSDFSIEGEFSSRTVDNIARVYKKVT